MKRADEVDVNVAADAVTNMVTCNHGNLDAGTMSLRFRSLESNENIDVASYFQCVERKQPLLRVRRKTKPISVQFVRNEYVRHCLPLLTERCKNASVRLTKFIRLSMHSIEPILRRLENISPVKVVHLVRDPRAMLDSQLRKNDLRVRNFYMFQRRTRQMCSRIREDIRLAQLTKQRYPNTIYSIRYEDIVDKQMSTFSNLFSFLGLHVTEGVRKYISETSTNVSEIYKRYIWRQTIPQRNLLVVDKYCSDIYGSLGYLPFSSIGDVRDRTNPDHTEVVW